MILQLLPANKIKEGVEIIKKIINVKYQDDKKTLKKWNKFMTFYFENEWMKKVTPQVFSVFMSCDRTNNYLESYHRAINQMIRTKPTVSHYIR